MLVRHSSRDPNLSDIVSINKEGGCLYQYLDVFSPLHETKGKTPCQRLTIYSTDWIMCESIAVDRLLWYKIRDYVDILNSTKPTGLAQFSQDHLFYCKVAELKCLQMQI